MGDTLSDKMEPGVRLRPASLSKTSKYWVQITWQPFDQGVLRDMMSKYGLRLFHII